LLNQSINQSINREGTPNKSFYSTISDINERRNCVPYLAAKPPVWYWRNLPYNNALIIGSWQMSWHCLPTA